MSGPHTFIPRPPVLYRTHTPWWVRLGRRVAIALASLATITLLVVATTALIARLHATEAALDRSFQQGLGVGLAACGSRT